MPAPSGIATARHRHGPVGKPVKDPYVNRALARGCRRVDGGRTFRRGPEGVNAHDQSRRMRGLAALGWPLGLSLRSAGHLLTALGHHQSRMRVGRDVPEAGSNGLRKRLAHARKKVSRRLDGIEGRDWHKSHIWKLLTELPEGGGQELRRMETRL